MTTLPFALGSGKLVTPWDRMQFANRSAGLPLEAVVPVPPVLPEDPQAATATEQMTTAAAVHRRSPALVLVVALLIR
jgi:hypothetical protein